MYGRAAVGVAAWVDVDEYAHCAEGNRRWGSRLLCVLVVRLGLVGIGRWLGDVLVLMRTRLWLLQLCASSEAVVVTPRVQSFVEVGRSRLGVDLLCVRGRVAVMHGVIGGHGEDRELRSLRQVDRRSNHVVRRWICPPAGPRWWWRGVRCLSGQAGAAHRSDCWLPGSARVVCCPVFSVVTGTVVTGATAGVQRESVAGSVEAKVGLLDEYAQGLGTGADTLEQTDDV